MTGAIGVAKAGDGLRYDLDPAARRRQGRALRIAAELADRPAIPSQGRQDEFPVFPEFSERWGVDAPIG